MLENNLRVILIGGSSNVGKSTVAQSMAMKLGWSFLSTDSLARHPGRPWKGNRGYIPDHVVEHYAFLSVDELITDVLRHYRRIWPNIETIIKLYTNHEFDGHLILEGSALWPESVATLDMNKVKAIWLSGDDELFKKRIYHESRYTKITTQEKFLVDKFLARTILYNEKMMGEINRLRLVSLEVTGALSMDDLSERCLRILSQ